MSLKNTQLSFLPNNAGIIL